MKKAKIVLMMAVMTVITFVSCNGKNQSANNMGKIKIPGVSFSLNRALGITQAKQKFARETGIPTSKAGLERKIGKMVLDVIFNKGK